MQRPDKKPFEKGENLAKSIAGFETSKGASRQREWTAYARSHALHVLRPDLLAELLRAYLAHRDLRRMARQLAREHLALLQQFGELSDALFSERQKRRTLPLASEDRAALAALRAAVARLVSENCGIPKIDDPLSRAEENKKVAEPSPVDFHVEPRCGAV